LILNRIWDFQFVSSKEQAYLDLLEEATEGYGGNIISDESGEASNDDFDLVWDWNLLNWNIITELYNEIDEIFSEEGLDQHAESGTNFYGFIFISAVVFWMFCKIYRFPNYSSGSFELLVPLYRTDRYNDVFRFFFTDYVGSGRNRSLGSNYVGANKILMQHGNTSVDEYLRTGYFPLKTRFKLSSMEKMYKWLSVFNYREQFIKTHLHLTNNILTFRRSNTFFKKNSLLWMKYGRLNRSLIDDISGFRDKNIFLSNLSKQEHKLQTIIDSEFYEEMQKALRKEQRRGRRRIRRPIRYTVFGKRRRRKRHYVFRFGLWYDKYAPFQSRIRDILYFRNSLSVINGIFNAGIYDNFLKFYKKTEFLDNNLKFKQKIYKTQLEDLLRLTGTSYHEGLRLLLFGSKGINMLNEHILNKKRLTKDERLFLYGRFLKKLNPLNRYGFFSRYRNAILKRRSFSNPVVFENVFMKVFLRRLRKSHKFKGNPFMTTMEYFAIYMRRKNKRRKPLRQPDIDYVSKIRGSIRSLGNFSFLLNTKYNNNFNSLNK